MPQLLQSPCSTWLPPRIRWTWLYAHGWGGCGRSRREQPPWAPTASSPERDLSAKGLRSSLVCPRCKPPFPTELVSDLSLLELGLALGPPPPRNQLVPRDNQIILIGISEPVPPAGCWELPSPWAQTLSLYVHTCLGTPGARRGVEGWGGGRRGGARGAGSELLRVGRDLTKSCKGTERVAPRSEEEK